MKKKLKDAVEKKGLKLSVTVGGKEGMSKMIASCGFLENELSQISKEEGVTVADSVETLGVDSRTVKRLGAKETARRKKCKVRFSIIKKNKSRSCYVQAYCQQGLGEPMRLGFLPLRGCFCGDRWRRQLARRVQPRCPCSWRQMALKLRKISPPWPLSIGQKEFGQEIGVTS